MALTQMISRWTAFALLVMLILPGCNATDEVAIEEDGNYRKITVPTRDDREGATRENEQGLVHLDSDEFDKAEDAFKRAIELDDEFGPAYNHLGKVYFLQRKYYDAAHHFDRAAALMPRHAAPQYNLGLTLQSAGKTDDATEHFRKAMTLDPFNFQYQADLARALLSRGEATTEVVTLLRSVAEQHPNIKLRSWASQELGRLGIDN